MRFLLTFLCLIIVATTNRAKARTESYIFSSDSEGPVILVSIEEQERQIYTFFACPTEVSPTGDCEVLGFEGGYTRNELLQLSRNRRWHSTGQALRGAGLFAIGGGMAAGATAAAIATAAGGGLIVAAVAVPAVGIGAIGGALVKAGHNVFSPANSRWNKAKFSWLSANLLSRKSLDLLETSDLYVNADYNTLVEALHSILESIEQ